MAEVEIPHPDEVKEHAENPFTRQIALFVAVYAVGLAVASFGGHNAAKEMMLVKQEESRTENTTKQDEFNAWSQFQAKAVREALYKNERTQLEIEKAGTPTGFPGYKQKQLEYFTAEEKRMKQDKDELAAKAKEIHDAGEKKLDHVRGELKKYMRKDPYFDFAEVIFQVAIVMASVAMLSEKRWAFLASLGLAGVSIFLTVNGFTLLAAVPGFEDAAPAAH